MAAILRHTEHTLGSLRDVLAGQIQVYASNKSVLLPLIQSGRLRGRAVASAERWPELPDVPTLHESGLDGYPTTLSGGLNWMGAKNISLGRHTLTFVAFDRQRNVSHVSVTVYHGNSQLGRAIERAIQSFALSSSDRQAVDSLGDHRVDNLHLAIVFGLLRRPVP